jgi:hypothetical protein
MAHPSLTKWAQPQALEAKLGELKEKGAIDGVEARYNKHTRAQTAAYLKIARRLGIISTGGSDFHGDVKPNVRLGDVTSGYAAPRRALDELKKAIAKIRSDFDLSTRLATGPFSPRRRD